MERRNARLTPFAIGAEGRKSRTAPAVPSGDDNRNAGPTQSRWSDRKRRLLTGNVDCPLRAVFDPPTTVTLRSRPLHRSFRILNEPNFRSGQCEKFIDLRTASQAQNRIAREISERRVI